MKSLTRLILDTAKSPTKVRNLATNKMIWPTLLHGLYNDGLQLDIAEQTWMNVFAEELERLEVDYLPCWNGGKINTRRFQKILVPDPTRIALYGQPRPDRHAVRFFEDRAKQESDMNRLFGENALPVISMPRLVEEGIKKNKANKRVNPARLRAIDQIFAAASIEIPMVRLIYTYCVLFAAHPSILRAGGDLHDKAGWIQPTTRRTDKELWSVAFCFSALYQSKAAGSDTCDTFDYSEIHKGFIGMLCGLFLRRIDR